MSDTVYYDILGITRGSTDSDVKNAYRKAAFKWHPEKHTGQQKELARQKFTEIAEAYTVLSDKKLRATFDQYGQNGLINGVNGAPGWTFTSTPIDVYTSFFGDPSPLTSLPSSGSRATPTQTKADPLVMNIYASLEELSQGAMKQVKVVRQVIVDGQPRPEEKIIKVTVQPGWKENTKLTFPNSGDEEVDMETGDLILVLKEKPHPRFKRDKNDLVYTAKISLLQALTGTVVDVELLDGRILPVAVNDIAKPGYKVVVPGEGMPLAKDSKSKGNLVVDFDVQYPDVLSIKQKEQLALVLPQ